MIDKIIKVWDNRKNELEEQFKEKHPDHYSDIVKKIFTLLKSDKSFDYDDRPNSAIIHEINDGSYEGTILFLCPSGEYTPYKYYYCLVNYGSCSGCDTYEYIRNIDYGDIPTEEQVKQYMTLALHIVQSIKLLS